MPIITEAWLLNELEGLYKQRENAAAVLNQIDGAIQVLEQQVAYLSTVEKADSDEPDSSPLSAESMQKEEST